MGARLDDARLEDLISELTIVGLRAQERFDPSVGQAEPTYLYRRMRVRIIDWYRHNYGDRRSHDPLIDPKSATLYGPHNTGELVDDEDHETDDETYAETIERLSLGLSAEAQHTVASGRPGARSGLPAARCRPCDGRPADRCRGAPRVPARGARGGRLRIPRAQVTTDHERTRTRASSRRSSQHLTDLLVGYDDDRDGRDHRLHRLGIPSARRT